MGREIERKFLVKNNSWRVVPGAECRQGYLNKDKERTVRVRTINHKGYLTVKGISEGATRLEFEYEIPVNQAEEILTALCEKPLIEKKRYRVPLGKVVFEIDEFFKENKGLIVAEVELENENQQFDKPDWLGKEVTGDPRYFNSNLIKHPFTTWNLEVLKEHS